MFNKIKNSNIFIKHQNWVAFFILLILSFFTNAYFLKMHYSSDSYSLLGNQLGQIQQSFRLGRISTSFFLYLLNYNGINLVKYQILFTFVSILILTLSAHLLFLKLKSFLSGKKLGISYLMLLFSIFIIIYNPFALELFTFPEMLPFSSLALLCVIISFNFLFKNNNIKNKIFSSLFLALSLTFYQGWAPLFVLLSLFSYFAKNVKEYFFRYFQIATIYFSAVISNILFIKISSFFVSQSERFQNLDIIKNAQETLNYQFNIWINAFNFLPEYYFLISIIIFAIVTLGVLMLLNKDLIALELLELILGVFTAVIVSLLPVMLSSPVWIVPRTVASLGGIIGIFSFRTLYYFGKFKKPPGIYWGFFIILSLVNVGIFINCERGLAKMQIRSNSLDREEIKKYYKVIYNYEQENKININNLYFIKSKQPVYCHPGITCYGDFNARILLVDWSNLEAFNNVTKRNFKKGSSSGDNFIVNSFDISLHSFNKNEIKFKDDYAYLYIY